ncbi:MAG: hypothetical protein LBJ18_00450 [Rickettsiales bacterium]|jgi:antitoxin VapB|nr:hypothetical protein [Rickettsiales bacterium]
MLTQNDTSSDIAKVFMTGRSQAVRIPKAFKFNSDELVIKPYMGGGVILQYPPKKTENWLVNFLKNTTPNPDFVLDRPDNTIPQKRDLF